MQSKEITERVLEKGPVRGAERALSVKACVRGRGIVGFQEREREIICV